MATLQDLVELLRRDHERRWRRGRGGLWRPSWSMDDINPETKLQLADSLLTCTVSYPGTVRPENLAVVSNWLQRINLTVVVGAFEVVDGRWLRVRAAIDVRDVDMDVQLVTNLVKRCESTAYEHREQATEFCVRGAVPHLFPKPVLESLEGLRPDAGISMIGDGSSLSDHEVLTVVKSRELNVWFRFWALLIARRRDTMADVAMPDLEPALIKLVKGDTSAFTPDLVALLGAHGPRSLIGPLREIANERGSPVPGVARASTVAADAIRARFIDGSTGGLTLTAAARSGELSLPEPKPADERTLSASPNDPSTS